MTKSTKKQLRMEKRREIGNRKPRLEQPKLERIGPAYLFPYVCFTCRKSFKRKFDEGLPDKICPGCGGTAVGLSRNFKAPAARDVKQWQKVAFLVEHGFRFDHQRDSEGNLVPYPATMAEARRFVTIYGGARGDSE